MKKEKTKKAPNKLKGYKGLRKLIPYYKRYLGLFILTIVLMLLSAGVGFLNPIFSAQALANLSEAKFDIAIYFALGVLGVRVATSVINYYSNYCYIKMDTKVVFDIKTSLINAITSVTMSKNDKINNGIYIERLHEDSGKCSDVLLDIMSVALELISNIAFLIYIAFLNIWFFLMLLAYVAVLWIFDNKKEYVWYIQRRKFRDKREMATGAYNEQIRGLRDLKSLNIRSRTIADAGNKFKESQDVNLTARNTRRKFVMGRDIVATIFEVGFFLAGILFIRNSWITLAEFLVIYMYHGNVRGLSSYFACIKQYATEGELAAQRIFEIIDEYPKEKFGDEDMDIKSSDIQFKNVNFAYNEGMPVLSDLTLTFKANKTTAIVGRSGSGKSTILSLMNKLYTIDSGEITIDGVNIDRLSEKSLRDGIGVVTQAPYIFNRTIRENLLFINENATEEEMISALKRAHIYDFVCENGGLDSKVGENGVMLSGGQKQRLAIARVLLKNSPIIVLDEATSALDNESQQLIVNAIDDLKKDHTIIIVAHRLSTILDADSIMVLDKGKVIDEGTHKELYRRCKEYKELYKNEETTDMLTKALQEKDALPDELKASL